MALLVAWESHCSLILSQKPNTSFCTEVGLVRYLGWLLDGIPKILHKSCKAFHCQLNRSLALSCVIANDHAISKHAWNYKALLPSVPGPPVKRACQKLHVPLKRIETQQIINAKGLQTALQCKGWGTRCSKTKWQKELLPPIKGKVRGAAEHDQKTIQQGK